MTILRQPLREELRAKNVRLQVNERPSDSRRRHLDCTVAENQGRERRLGRLD